MEQEEKRDIVALTGLPVSNELQDILERCDRGEYVSIEEINNTPEMITAATCVSHQTPTILLKDREGLYIPAAGQFQLRGVIHLPNYRSHYGLHYHQVQLL